MEELFFDDSCEQPKIIFKTRVIMLTVSFKKYAPIFLSIMMTLLINTKSYATDLGLFSQNLYCDDMSSSIEKYACLTEHAAKGIEFVYASSGIILKPYEVAVFEAIEAMNLVQNIAGSGRYAYLKYMQAHFKRPPSVFRPTTDAFEPPAMENQDACLRDSFGICGNHQFLFVAILQLLGVEARPVDFYYSLNGHRYSHAAAEIKINDHWGYFDITWGSYWLQSPDDPLSVESLEDVLAGKGKQMLSNNSWYVATRHSFSLLGLPGIFSYLNAKDVQILRNKGGRFVLSFNQGHVDFSDQPSYFGTPPEYSPLKMQLSANAPSGDASIDISGIGGDCAQSCMKVGSKCYPIIHGTTRITIAPNAIIEIEGEDRVCYAVISSLNKID
jgi:hypothetical protein